MKDNGEIEREKIEAWLQGELDPIQHLPRRTHPGAKNGAVSCRLMVRVARLMLDRLRVHEAVEGQRTNNDEQREGFLAKEAHNTTS